MASGNVSSTLDLQGQLNASDNNGKRFYYYETEQLTFMFILAFLVISFNLMVLVGLGISKSRTRMGFWVLHLALADLLVGTISIPTDIAWQITYEWYAGNAGCKLIRYAQVVVTFASNYVLVALSIDRYDAIANPLTFTSAGKTTDNIPRAFGVGVSKIFPDESKNRSKSRYSCRYILTVKRSRRLVAAAWFFSFLFSTPMLFLYEQDRIDGYLQCWISFPSQVYWQVYFSSVSITLFFMPVIIIISCFAVVLRIIWVRGKDLQFEEAMSLSRQDSFEGSTSRAGSVLYRSKRLVVGNGNTGAQTPTSSQTQTIRSEVVRGLIPRAKIKTTKMALVIVLVFIACWSPYCIYDLLDVFQHVEFADPQTKIAVSTLMQSLAPLNSVANPVISCLYLRREITRGLYRIQRTLRRRAKKAKPTVTRNYSFPSACQRPSEWNNLPKDSFIDMAVPPNSAMSIKCCANGSTAMTREDSRLSRPDSRDGVERTNSSTRFPLVSLPFTQSTHLSNKVVYD